MIKKVLWFFRNIKYNILYVVGAGRSRDGAYAYLYVGPVELRWWKSRKPKMDVIWWRTKLRVIKGAVDESSK